MRQGINWEAQSLQYQPSRNNIPSQIPPRSVVNALNPPFCTFFGFGRGGIERIFSRATKIPPKIGACGGLWKRDLKISIYTSITSANKKLWSLLNMYLRPKAKLASTKGEPLHGKWCFLYMNDFEATRRFLDALKIAADSWDFLWQDTKMWSTFFDL